MRSETLKMRKQREIWLLLFTKDINHTQKKKCEMKNKGESEKDEARNEEKLHGWKNVMI